MPETRSIRGPRSSSAMRRSRMSLTATSRTRGCARSSPEPLRRLRPLRIHRRAFDLDEQRLLLGELLLLLGRHISADARLAAVCLLERVAQRLDATLGDLAALEQRGVVG